MSAKKGHPKRGISVYSYHNLLGRTMTLEDCFEEMYDTGATCFELLTSYIDNYPNPSPAWVDKYWRLCEKYNLEPAELGHWAENHLRRGPGMSDEEVESAIAKDLWLDIWEWQKSQPGGPISYVPAKGGSTDGLERAVFTCPSCGSFGTLRSKGDTIGCTCGFKTRLNDTGFGRYPGHDYGARGTYCILRQKRIL